MELLVDYGDDYAITLGIKTGEMEKYRRREDHRSDGFDCPHCSRVLATAVAWKEHQEKGGGGRYRCSGLRAKRKLNRAAVNQPARKLSRQVEGGGTSAGSYPCPVAACGKFFSEKSSVKRHYVTVHKGRKDFKVGFNLG